MSIYRVPTHRQQTKARPRNTGAWREASAAWLQKYPLCVLCLVRGKLNDGADAMRATTQRNLVVDHIEPHRGNLELFWDESNWETLCRCPCHDVDKQRHEQRGGTGAEWRRYLLSEIKRCGTQDTVASMGELLPHGWGRGVSALEK